jgi:hypothetical protein
VRKGLGLFAGAEGPGSSEAASEGGGSATTGFDVLTNLIKGETMIRVKALAGVVVGGLMMVGGMGCQQAPAPGPTVVVEHQGNGHDRDRQPPPPQDRRDQSQQDRDRKNAPPPPRQQE